MKNSTSDMKSKVVYLVEGVVMLYRDLDIDQLICLTFDLVQIIFKKIFSRANWRFFSLKIDEFIYFMMSKKIKFIMH